MPVGTVVCNEISWLIDPNNKFMRDDPNRLLGSLGIIPNFITNDTKDVIQEALNRYQFGGPEMKGGEVDKDGVYLYPQDPPLYPLASCMAGGKRIYIYQYGMISFVDLITREANTYRFD